jgi:hypothetical protein
LIHDLLDRTIPSRHSRRLKDTWRRARLIETCGFGHRRVLEAELVAQAIVAFLVTLPGGGAPDPVAARCVPAIEAKTPRSGSSPVKLPC